MIENFDLNGWILFSDRRNSQSYHSADKKWMVKFNTDFASEIEDAFIKEKEIVDTAIKANIKTPKVKDVVKLSDGRMGIIYEYIEGKKSIARATSENLDKIDYYMGRFAKSAKDFHSHECNIGNIIPWEDRMRRNVAKTIYLNDKRRQMAYDLMDKTEKKTKAILGDFHTGNFIITDKEEYVIDIGSLSYGNPIYDIAIFHWFSSIFPEFITKNIFHCGREHQFKMWDSFVKQYFGYNDDELKKFTEAIKKYSFISFTGMFDFVDATPDKELIQEIIDANYEKWFENTDLLSV